jgi:hypothetical protein
VPDDLLDPRGPGGASVGLLMQKKSLVALREVAAHLDCDFQIIGFNNCVACIDCESKGKPRDVVPYSLLACCFNVRKFVESFVVSS